LTGLQQVRGDVSHRRSARGTLPVTKRLGQKGPEHDLGGEDVLLSKQRALFLEDAPDPLGIQNIRERQPVALEEWFRNSIKSVLVTPMRCGYGVHYKALPGFVEQPSQGGQ